MEVGGFPGVAEETKVRLQHTGFDPEPLNPKPQTPNPKP